MHERMETVVDTTISVQIFHFCFVLDYILNFMLFVRWMVIRTDGRLVGFAFSAGLCWCKRCEHMFSVYSYQFSESYGWIFSILCFYKPNQTK